MRERTLTWEKNINKISKTAGKYPQEIYSAVVYAIQSEWIFLQYVTWYTGDVFAGVEKMIWETFLTCIFFVKTKNLSPTLGTLSMMPINMDGLGLLNPVTPAKEKYLISHRVSAELIQEMMGGGALSNANHLRTLWEEMRDGQKDWEVANKTKPKGLVQDLKDTDMRLILREKNQRCLAERMRHYSFRYSIVCYRISVFLMCTLQPPPPQTSRATTTDVELLSG